MEDSWIYSSSFEEFEKEGHRFWNEYVGPHFSKLRQDPDFWNRVEIHGGIDILNQKFLTPSFPMELILSEHTERFGSVLECLKEALVFCAWRRKASFFSAYSLNVAVAEGVVNPGRSSWCKQCGSCCTQENNLFSLTENDEDRIVEFYRENEAWGPGAQEIIGEEACVDQLSKYIAYVDFLGKQVHLLEGGKMYVLACPFLDRLNSEKNLCLIDAVKPEMCRQFGKESCRSAKLENGPESRVRALGKQTATGNQLTLIKGGANKE